VVLRNAASFDCVRPTLPSLKIPDLKSGIALVTQIFIDKRGALFALLFIVMNTYSSMSKAARQKTILELVHRGPIESQEELQGFLAKRGFDVGQATLSRDIRELGLVKTYDGYMPPQAGAATETVLPSVSRLVREFVIEVRLAQNLLVLKTSVGSAQPVAAAVDAENWPEVVGTLGGDDTILVISQDNKTAQQLTRRIQGMLA